MPLPLLPPHVLRPLVHSAPMLLSFIVVVSFLFLLAHVPMFDVLPLSLDNVSVDVRLVAKLARTPLFIWSHTAFAPRSKTLKQC